MIKPILIVGKQRTGKTTLAKKIVAFVSGVVINTIAEQALKKLSDKPLPFGEKCLFVDEVSSSSQMTEIEKRYKNIFVRRVYCMQIEEEEEMALINSDYYQVIRL